MAALSWCSVSAGAGGAAMMALSQLISRAFRSFGRRIEFQTLLMALACAGGVWAFAEIAEEVQEGETGSVDRAVLLWFRSADDVNDPIGPAWFESGMRDITAIGGVAVLTLVTVGAVSFLWLRGQRRLAILLALSVLVGMGLSNLGKHLFSRPRPDLVAHGDHVLTASFPSGHSMMSAIVYLTIGGLVARSQPRRRLKAFVLGAAMLLTLLVGVSRVYLGVHWPTDVLAGWVAGVTWALVCWLVAHWFQVHARTNDDDMPAAEA